MMLVIVAYDVSTESEEGRRRLRHVAKVCEDFGQRVQNSVFECLVDAAQWTRLRARLATGTVERSRSSLACLAPMKPTRLANSRASRRLVITTLISPREEVLSRETTPNSSSKSCTPRARSLLRVE